MLFFLLWMTVQIFKGMTCEYLIDRDPVFKGDCFSSFFYVAFYNMLGCFGKVEKNLKIK